MDSRRGGTSKLETRLCLLPFTSIASLRQPRLPATTWIAGRRLLDPLSRPPLTPHTFPPETLMQILEAAAPSSYSTPEAALEAQTTYMTFELVCASRSFTAGPPRRLVVGNTSNAIRLYFHLASNSSSRLKDCTELYYKCEKTPLCSETQEQRCDALVSVLGQLPLLKLVQLFARNAIADNQAPRESRCTLSVTVLRALLGLSGLRHLHLFAVYPIAGSVLSR